MIFTALLNLVLSISSSEILECKAQEAAAQQAQAEYRNCVGLYMPNIDACRPLGERLQVLSGAFQSCVLPQGENGLTNAFDGAWYLRKYPDILNAFGWDPNSARNHYYNRGVYESRIGSLTFDPQYYLLKNPDVANAYGASNWGAALNHWLTHGIAEGRVASPFFSITYYMQHNPDIVSAYGGNRELIIRHAMTSGLIEARPMTPNYNWKTVCTEPSGYRSCIYNYVRSHTR